MLIPVEFYNRHGKMLRKADYISKPYAMEPIVKHMAAHPANIVKVDGRLCFTLNQAERQVDSLTSL